MVLAEKTVNEMIDRLGKGESLDKLSDILQKHAEHRIDVCEKKIRRYEEKYGSFAALQDKVLTRKHTLDEERTLFNWEATMTELGRLRRFLAK